MSQPTIFFFGDNQGHFRHIIEAVEQHKLDAIMLHGDVQASQSLERELAPILGKTVIRLIHGNHGSHDTGSDFDFHNLFESKSQTRTSTAESRTSQVCGSLAWALSSAGRFGRRPKVRSLKATPNG